MAVDTPATLAILGAGPIGIEAALYARFLGYDVDLFDRGDIASNVLAWGHVPLFTPFGMNRSPLGLAALAAQDENYQPPADEARLTGLQFVADYLLPLARTDLLKDHLHLNTEVIAVGREGLTKTDMPGDAIRAASAFRILVRAADGTERICRADVVIDATGTYGNPRWMGDGGIPAIGETAFAPRIAYDLPDIVGKARARYAGRHTLVVGSGYSAATSLVALGRLVAESPETRVTWITRRPGRIDSEGIASNEPIARIPNDTLASRDALAEEANRLAAEGGSIRHLPGVTIESIEGSDPDEPLMVHVSGADEASLVCDQILANVGYVPNTDMFSELQVHQCYSTGGPMALAVSLLNQPSADCLDQTSPGPDLLRTSEPNFYLLGSKSYGRDSRFLLSIGLEQIRQIFTILGDRENLDLYGGVQYLVPQ